MPLVSVIVPVFNVAPFLEKCLSSILASTLTDIEVICVDDCSTDDSPRILADFASRDQRLRVIRHEQNLHAGGARNTAIRVATADYLASVDGDDWVEPDMFATLLGATDGGTADIVECGMVRRDEADAILGHIAPRRRRIKPQSGDVDIFSCLNPGFWNKLWRRRLITDNDLWFPEHTHHEDLAFTPQAVALASDIRTIPATPYNYVIHPRSSTAGTSARHQMDYFKVFDILAGFLEKRGELRRRLPAFLDCVDVHLHYHARNVAQSDLPEAEKRQYLRHFLMMKRGYLANYLALEDMSSHALEHAIRRRDPGFEALGAVGWPGVLRAAARRSG